MIRFQHHDDLELHRIEYGGVLTGDELTAHAAFRSANPQWLNYDHINIILPGADIRQLTRGALRRCGAGIARCSKRKNW